MKPIKLYWFGGNKDFVNFGDTFSPKAVEYATGRPVVWAPPQSCDMAAIGSLMEKISRKKWQRLLRGRLSPIRFWGTGSMGTGPIDNLRGMHFHAVRGPKTQNGLGLSRTPRFGDAGLFADMYRKPKSGKSYRWGIIPHMADRHILQILEMMENTPDSTIIDLTDPDMPGVVQKIDACDYIASSSLHGLITADALGIPNAWIQVSNNVGGGAYKFVDYFLPMGRRDTPADVTQCAGDLRRIEDGLSCASVKMVNDVRASLLSALDE